MQFLGEKVHSDDKWISIVERKSRKGELLKKGGLIEKASRPKSTVRRDFQERKG